MPEILIVALPPIGHLWPLLHVAQSLTDRGDRVTVLTSARHAARVRAVGAVPQALPAEADPYSTGADTVRSLMQPMPHQTRLLADLLAHTPFDAMIVDAGFFGILPFLLGNRAARPPVLIYSTTPLTVSRGRLRRGALGALSRNAASYVLDRMHCRPPTSLLNVGALAERYIAPTVPEFDYPHTDLPANLRYVGAVHPVPAHGFRPPPWWAELDGERTVVHVTQGTTDIADFGQLLEPTIHGLAGEDIVVVATTGGASPVRLKVRLPLNTFVAEYIPHDLLLPKVNVMVTNGGYGAVQRALSTGVPLVVAGDTDNREQVAARVAWSGAGINLRTGTPTVGAVRSAVRTVLTEQRYRRRAWDLEAAFARRDGVAEIEAQVDEVIAERRAVTECAGPEAG